MSRPALTAIAERSARTGAYAVVSVAGVASILWTPVTITAVLGPGAALAWGVLLLAGGIVCTIASLTELYLVEFPAILIVVAGLTIYLTALWSLTLDDTITRATQTTIITAYALHLLARHVELRRLAAAST